MRHRQKLVFELHPGSDWVPNYSPWKEIREFSSRESWNCNALLFLGNKLYSRWFHLSSHKIAFAILPPRLFCLLFCAISYSIRFAGCFILLFGYHDVCQDFNLYNMWRIYLPITDLIHIYHEICIKSVNQKGKQLGMVLHGPFETDNVITLCSRNYFLWNRYLWLNF